MLKKIKLSNKVYDVLKIISILIIPIITFVTALGDIWGLPYQVQILKTLTAIEVFVGALLKISSDNYHEEHKPESYGAEPALEPDEDVE